MANLNVIYRIAADVTALEKGVASIDGRMGRLGSLAGEVGKGLASAFTATAVIAGIGRMVTSSIEYADELSNLSAKTHMTAEELQQLQALGRPVGVTLDEMSRAALALYKNLDSPQGKEAIAKMGLDYARLRTLNPQQLFLEIGQAVGKIHDPIDQANRKTDLFGKTFDAVAAAFDQDVDAIVKNTTVLKNAQVAGLDLIGDMWDDLTDRVSKGTKSWVADIGLRLLFYQKLYDFVRGSPIPDLKPPPAPTNLRPLDPVIKNWEEFGRIAKEQEAAVEESIRKRERATREAADEATRSRKQYLEMSKEAMGAEYAWQAATLLTKFKTDQLTVAETQLYDVVSDLTSFLNAHKGEMFPEPPIGKLEDWITTQRAANAETEVAATRTQTMNKHLGVVESVLGNIQTAWAQTMVVATRAITAVSTKLAEGDWVGAIVAAAAALGGFIAKLIKSEESAKVSPLRDVFFVAAGGLEVLNPKVEQLTGSLKLVEAIFAAKTVDQYNKAIKELNDLFDFQIQAMQTLEETAKKYGLTIEELGPAWQKQQLDKKAQELYKDYQILISAGVDNVLVIKKMSGAINEYVQNALKMGHEIPIAMKPMLEDMIKNGQLIDANGRAYTSLEETGISFAMTMTEGFKALITEVQQLTEMIARSLGVALNKIPHPKAPWADWPPPPEVPDYGDNNNNSENAVPHLAGGGEILRSGLAVVHRGETVVPPGRGRVGGIVVNVNASGAFLNRPGDIERLADQVSDAVMRQYRRERRLDAA